jgi:hypothetical protein
MHDAVIELFRHSGTSRLSPLIGKEWVFCTSYDRPLQIEKKAGILPDSYGFQNGDPQLG